MATEINAGRVAMVPRGEWSASTAYVRLDVVQYNGSSYVSIQDSTGQNPSTATTYWQLLASGVDPSNYYTKTETNTKLAGKQDALVSGQNIKSINGQSVLGEGNLELGELFVVTMTRHNSVYTADKSVSEIYAASYTNGKPVIAVMRDINNPVFILTDCNPDGDSYVFSAIESNVVTTLRWQQTDEYTYELETIALQSHLVSGTNIKTVNNESLLGSGNVTIAGKSAYQSYVDTTTDSPVKTEAEWVASLKGEDGHDGVSLGEVAIVNNLTEGGTEKVLSAEMGKVLGDNLEIIGDEIRQFHFERKDRIFEISTSNYCTSDIIPVPCDITINVTDTGENTASLSYIVYCKNSTIITTELISRTLTKQFNISASDNYDYVLVRYLLGNNPNFTSLTASVVYSGANNNRAYDTIHSKYYNNPTSINLLDSTLVQQAYMGSNGNAIRRNDSAYTWYIKCENEQKLYVHLTRTKGSSQVRCAFFGDLDLSSYIKSETLIAGGTPLSSRDCSVLIPTGAKYVRLELSFMGGADAVDYSQTYIGFYPFDQNRENEFYYFSRGNDDSSSVRIFTPNHYVTNEYLRNYANWESINNSLYSKVYVAMGDSITAGYLAGGTKYPNIIGSHLGATVINYASSGAHFTNYEDTKIDFGGSSGNSPNVIQNQVYRLLRDITPTTDIVPEIDENSEFTSKYSYPVYGLGVINANDIKVVTICAGTNDASNNLSIGSSSDASGTDYTTFNKRTLWGAAAWAITVLRKHLPNAHIVILTPPQRTSAQQTVKAWVDEELVIARNYCCQSIDLFGSCGISEQIERINGAKYLTDGLHPSSAGQQLIGDYIAGIFDALFKY